MPPRRRGAAMTCSGHGVRGHLPGLEVDLEALLLLLDLVQVLVSDG